MGMAQISEGGGSSSAPTRSTASKARSSPAPSTGSSTPTGSSSPTERLSEGVKKLNEPASRRFTDPETRVDPVRLPSQGEPPEIGATGVLNDTVKIDTAPPPVAELDPEQQKLREELAAKLDNDPEFKNLAATDSEAALEFLFGDGNENVDLSALGTDARTRMEFVLDYTSSDPEKPVHFAKQFNDSGFHEGFQDSPIWGAASGNQVGHFLTAVDIGMEHTGAYPKPVELAAAIGHEKWGDDRGANPEVFQGLAGLKPLDHVLFQAAVGAVRDPERTPAEKYSAVAATSQAILPDLPSGSWTPNGWSEFWRRGNSQQDLRLTTYGVALGEMINAGEIKTTDEVAAFLQQNLSSQAQLTP